MPTARRQAPPTPSHDWRRKTHLFGRSVLPATARSDGRVAKTRLAWVLTLPACIGKAKASLATSGLAGEVVVADNGSTDSSLEYVRANFPEVRAVELSKTNLGFAEGYNRA